VKQRDKILLGRMKRLLEAQTTQEWVQLLREVDDRIDLETLKSFKANLKKRLIRAEKEKTRAQKALETTSTEAKPPKRAITRRQVASEEFEVQLPRILIDDDVLLPDYRRFPKESDLRPPVTRPQDQDFSSWMRIIGRGMPDKPAAISNVLRPKTSKK